MDMLPSLSRVVVALMGFVAVMVLHESLTTKGEDMQATASERENLATSVAVEQSEPLKESNPEENDFNVRPHVSDQNAPKEQSNTDVSADTQSNGVSSDDIPTTIGGAQEKLEVSQLAVFQDDVEQAVSSEDEAASASQLIRWSAVWRPFFSRTTAQGFADYVSESTGLMLRVQASEVAGHYLVEVQHGTEAERIDADRRIVEFTGFKPPGAVQ